MTASQKHHDSSSHHQRLPGWGVVVFLLMVMTLGAGTLWAFDPSTSEAALNEAEFVYIPIKISSSEVIMLVIALIVIIQVVVNFKLLRWLPYKSLLIGSFTMVVFGAVCTTAEGFIFTDVLNYCEHLSVLAGSVLLALWCGLVFESKKQERP